MTKIHTDCGTLPDACARCGQAREARMCEDCGLEADVIDCGHYPQPAEIATSAHDWCAVCCACERERDAEQLELEADNEACDLYAEIESIASCAEKYEDARSAAYRAWSRYAEAHKADGTPLPSDESMRERIEDAIRDKP